MNRAVNLLNAAFRVLFRRAHSLFQGADAFYDDSTFGSIHGENGAALALVVTSGDDFYFITFFTWVFIYDYFLRVYAIKIYHPLGGRAGRVL